jgi:hypothetical protein
MCDDRGVCVKYEGVDVDVKKRLKTIGGRERKIAKAGTE